MVAGQDDVFIASGRLPRAHEMLPFQLADCPLLLLCLLHLVLHHHRHHLCIVMCLQYFAERHCMHTPPHLPALELTRCARALPPVMMMPSFGIFMISADYK